MKADLAAFLAATVVASLPTACAEAPHGRSTAETVGVGVERRTVALGIATDTAAKRSHARTFAVGSGEPGEDHLHWQGGPHQFLDYRGNSHRLFWDARHVGGLDRLEPGDGSIPKGPGADSVNTLFYLGHGYPHSWDIGSKSAELAKAGFGDHRLRYLLMCSCNVMEHAYLASAQQLQPTHVLGSVSNHFDRWVASETGAPLGRGLRLACGGATKVCSEFKKPALRTWDWILNKGYPIADAWVLGLSIGGRRSICLSRGTEDARSLDEE